jgi:hypothetical protein
LSGSRPVTSKWVTSPTSKLSITLLPPANELFLPTSNRYPAAQVTLFQLAVKLFVVMFVPAMATGASGGVALAVTFTIRVSSAYRPPLSVTRKVKLALVAEQDATKSAVTLPEPSTTRFETVTPFDGLVLFTVTVKAVGGSSLSLTVAICEFELPAPC